MGIGIGRLEIVYWDYGLGLGIGMRDWDSGLEFGIGIGDWGSQIGATIGDFNRILGLLGLRLETWIWDWSC